MVCDGRVRPVSSGRPRSARTLGASRQGKNSVFAMGARHFGLGDLCLQTSFISGYLSAAEHEPDARQRTAARELTQRRWADATSGDAMRMSQPVLCMLVPLLLACPAAPRAVRRQWAPPTIWSETNIAEPTVTEDLIPYI